MNELQEKKNALIEEINGIKNKNYLSTISASRIKQDLIHKIQNLDDSTIDVAIKLYVKGIRVNKNHSMDVLIGFRKDSSSTPLSNEEKNKFLNISILWVTLAPQYELNNIYEKYIIVEILHKNLSKKTTWRYL